MAKCHFRLSPKLCPVRGRRRKITACLPGLSCITSSEKGNGELSDQEQDNESHLFHREGENIVFEKPKSKEEIAHETRDREQHEFAREQVKTNRRLAWFTGLLVLGTFCGTGIGIWQATISQTAANAARDAVGVASRSLRETEASNARQAVLTEQARLSSERASSKALDATIESFRQDQRAWIGIDSWVLDEFQVGQPVRIKVRIMNRGKTPAVDVEEGGTEGLVISNDHTPKQIADAISKELAKFVFRPAAVISPSNGKELISDSKHVLEQGPMDALKNGISYWYTVGEVKYEDVFHRRQWMTYCLRISYENGSPRLLYCETGNSVSYQK